MLIKGAFFDSNSLIGVPTAMSLCALYANDSEVNSVSVVDFLDAIAIIPGLDTCVLFCALAGLRPLSRFANPGNDRRRSFSDCAFRIGVQTANILSSEIGVLNATLSSR